MLKNQSWQSLGDHIGCKGLGDHIGYKGSNLGQLYVKQVSYLLNYFSSTSVEII